MKWNLVGSIYGRSSLKIAHFVPIHQQHGHHRPFLFLIGWFLKNLWQKLTLLLAWWAKNENRTVAILWKALLYIWQCIFYMINRNSSKKNLWCRQGYISVRNSHAQVQRSITNVKHIMMPPIKTITQFWRPRQIISKISQIVYRTRWDIIDNVCLDLQNCCYSIFTIFIGIKSRRDLRSKWIFLILSVEAFRTEVIVFIGGIIMCFTFVIDRWTCACELRTDLIFLWFKVSSVIQTLSTAHIRGKMSNLPISCYTIDNQWQYIYKERLTKYR
jgi:hypothetical protein